MLGDIQEQLPVTNEADAAVEEALGLEQQGEMIRSMDDVADWELVPPLPPKPANRSIVEMAGRKYQVILDSGCSASSMPYQVALRILDDSYKAERHKPMGKAGTLLTSAPSGG